MHTLLLTIVVCVSVLVQVAICRGNSSLWVQWGMAPVVAAIAFWNRRRRKDPQHLGRIRRYFLRVASWIFLASALVGAVTFILEYGAPDSKVLNLLSRTGMSSRSFGGLAFANWAIVEACLAEGSSRDTGSVCPSAPREER